MEPFIVDKDKMLELVARKGLTAGSCFNNQVVLYTYVTKEEFDATLKDIEK